MNRHLNVLMPDGLLAAIDAAAAERSLNRSEFVRWVMGYALSEDALYYVYEPPTLPNWQTGSYTLLLRGLFGDARLVLTDEIRPLLEEAVAALDERSERVLRLRFGLRGARHTLAEVGAIFGVGRQRAYQVERTALARVRSWCRGRGMWELLKGQLNEEEVDR